MDRLSDDQSIAICSRGRIAWIGQQAVRYFAATAEELVDRPLEEIVQFRLRDSEERVENVFQLFSPGEGNSRSRGIDICFQSGDRIALSDRIETERRGDTNLAVLTLAPNDSKIVTYSEDITLLTETARMAQVGGWDLDRKTGQIRWTAQTFRIHELEPSSPPSLESALDFYLPKDRQIVAAAVEKALSEGEPYDLELRLRTAKGNIRFTRSICHPIIVDGETVRLHGTFQDVTDRRLAEQALLESETRYRDIFENNNAIKLLIDPETKRIVEANSAALQFYGYSAEAITKLTVADLNTADSNHISDCIQAAKGEGLTEFEFQHRLASGELRDVKVHSGTIKIKGKTFLHSIIFDITERKRAQDAVIQMQQLESLGTLAGGIAHDFNNVLTAVFGNILCVKEMVEPSHPAYPFLHGAENAVERARSLSQKLVTFAKGGVPICAPVSLSELVTEIVKFDLSGSNVRAEFYFDDELREVHADRSQLQQVFSNLCMNALQAMPDGGVIQIRATNKTVQSDQYHELPPGDYVQLAFEDNGTGIRKADLTRIFDPYFSTKETGHGLGLATCYSIIKKNGGRIEAESTFGQGTRFDVFLPVAEHRLLPPVVFDENQSAKLPPGLRVLILDDEQIILDVVKTMLQHDKAVVATCVNTSDAIRLYSESLESDTRYDVVILDLTIPGEPGGRDVLEKLLQIDTNICAICSSGYADAPVIAKYSDYGFKGSLAKPYKVTELRKAITDALASPGPD